MVRVCTLLLSAVIDLNLLPLYCTYPIAIPQLLLKDDYFGIFGMILCCGTFLFENCITQSLV